HPALQPFAKLLGRGSVTVRILIQIKMDSVVWASQVKLGLLFCRNDIVRWGDNVMEISDDSRVIPYPAKRANHCHSFTVREECALSKEPLRARGFSQAC